MGMFDDIQSAFGGRSSSHNRHSSHHRPSSVFSGRSSSYYKRRPRDNYIQQLLRKLKHFFKELLRYAQRHPMKIFFLVVMPLISGGVLHQMARSVGVDLPGFLKGGAGARGMGMGSGSASGGYYGSQGYESRGEGGGLGMGTLMGVAKAFM